LSEEGRKSGKEDDPNDSFFPAVLIKTSSFAALREPFPVCIENFHAAASIAT
jgi:hypothetical protein